jgi:hypothetical protein
VVVGYSNLKGPGFAHHSSAAVFIGENEKMDSEPFHEVEIRAHEIKITDNEQPTEENHAY